MRHQTQFAFFFSSNNSVSIKTKQILIYTSKKFVTWDMYFMHQTSDKIT